MIGGLLSALSQNRIANTLTRCALSGHWRQTIPSKRKDSEMGWLFYTDRRVKTYAGEKAEITRLCTFDTDSRKTELIKACKVGSTWYAAANVTMLDGLPVDDRTYVTDADGSITFAAVFLTRYDDGCWGY
jgi:hypothetical protein